MDAERGRGRGEKHKKTTQENVLDTITDLGEVRRACSCEPTRWQEPVSGAYFCTLAAMAYSSIAKMVVKTKN